MIEQLEGRMANRTAQAERNGYIRGVVKEIVHDSGRGEYIRAK